MTAIDCQETIARLSEPGGGDDAMACAHLEACPACREAAASMAALKATTQEPSPRALGAFATRVRAAHLRRQDAAQRSSPLRMGLVAGVCGAASAAGIALLLELAFPAPRLQRSGPASAEMAAAGEQYVVVARADDLWSDSAVDALTADFVSRAVGEEDLALAESEDLDESL
jgi:anti-sigma factor RsiW